MAIFKQLRGPFDESASLLSGEQLVKLGISIDEKDYMFNANPNTQQGVILEINGNQIEIGKTFIYQPGDFLTVSSLSFPNGGPDSTLVNIVYKIPTNITS